MHPTQALFDATPQKGMGPGMMADLMKTVFWSAGSLLTDANPTWIDEMRERDFDFCMAMVLPTETLICKALGLPVMTQVAHLVEPVIGTFTRGPSQSSYN